MQVYTIGHSTRSLEEFIEILKKFQIQLVVDVRKFPTSKKFPWFSKESLEKELKGVGAEYLHFPELGGYREGGYEAFSKTEEFSKALEKLIELINGKKVAIMCSERWWWRCHRRYISNALAEKRIEVTHILDAAITQEHKLREKEIEEKMKLKIWCDKKSIKHKNNCG